MTKKLFFCLLVTVLLALPLLASCNGDDTNTETPSTTTETETTNTPSVTASTGNWWDEFGEPQYGGKITLRVSELSTMQFDTDGSPVMSGQWLLYYDYLFNTDWTLDRNIWAFNTNYNPTKYNVGSLVESWEQTDAQTVVLHLREGVYFQDKEPVNGREFVADDVVYHYDRLCGTGNGFTEPSPYHVTFATTYFESATADDKYTVTIKFKSPSILNMDYFMSLSSQSCIEAPEVSQQYGDLTDWHNAVGTGPWILTDYVDGNSLSYVRNPNYWGYDERYPDNQLPYADELTVVCIPDSTTALAALRTGQIDFLSGVTWQQSQTVAKSNPELMQKEIPGSGTGLMMNLNNEPFTDITVRKALQMAVDIETINEAYYGGTADSTPCGMINPQFTDYAFTYDEWSQELKDEYTYNTDKAKELLAEAGYPDGLDLSCVTSSGYDTGLLEILKSQFLDIGVEMEITTMDTAAYTQFIMSGTHEHLAGPSVGGFARTDMPWTSTSFLASFSINPSTVSDPVYDEMVNSILVSTDSADLSQQIKDAEKYMLEHHWLIMCAPQLVSYNVYQPYLKGYSGELVGGLGGGNMQYFARWWLDEVE